LFYEHRHRLLKGQLILGRMDTSPEYSVLKLDAPDISNMGVSRYHAALVPLESGGGIHDLGSTNGTLVNGHRLATGLMRNLQHHDTIQLSKLRLHVHFIARDAVEEHTRANLLALFGPTVRDNIQTLAIPVESLQVLARRLPDNEQIQQRVLTACHAHLGPLTLEDVHGIINEVMGQEPTYNTDKLALPSLDLPGEATIPERSEQLEAAMRAMASGDLEMTQRVVAAPMGKDAGYSYSELLAALADYTTRAEAQLQHYLEQAALLPDGKERQHAFNTVATMMTQIRQWRENLS
jgi:predicted component of type VI protein secretion system